MVDCLIIGGGLIGLLSAYELVEAGLDVTVVERGEIGREASWAGGGILSPLYPWRYPEAITQLARWGQQAYPQLAQGLLEETGIDAEWYQSGMLILDPEEQDEAMAWAERHAERMTLIDRAGMLQYEPQVGKQPESALCLPDVAQIRNPWLVKSLRQSLIQRGAALLEHHETMGFLQQQGRIAGVKTRTGDIQAPNVVVATGAWSASLLKELDVELDVTPVRGQMLLYKTRPGTVSRIVLDKGRYVIPRRDGHTLVGSTLEYVGFDKTITEDAAQELKVVAETLIPALAEYSVIKQWAGLRPGSQTGIPYIGQHPEIEGLYINTGHFRNGVVMGPASGRLMADLVLKRMPIVDEVSYAIPKRKVSKVVLEG